jgi:hypothetical protein
LQGATMPYRHGFDNLRTKSKPPAGWRRLLDAMTSADRPAQR